MKEARKVRERLPSPAYPGRLGVAGSVLILMKTAVIYSRYGTMIILAA